MKRKLIALCVGSALLAPAAALGAKPVTGPETMVVLRGTLSAFTAPTATTTGSVTVLVSGGNAASRPYRGLTLTFTLGTATKVAYDGDGLITDGEVGLVKIRAAKATPVVDLLAKTPFQVVDLGD